MVLSEVLAADKKNEPLTVAAQTSRWRLPDRDCCRSKLPMLFPEDKQMTRPGTSR
jgi:hypothetical protein